MSKAQTDNSFLQAKIDLRALHLPEGPVHVLDCFGGEGKVWNGVKEKTKRDIEVTRIDQKDGLTGVYLKGHNLKYLQSLDLTPYNVIDLDAYGIPYKILDHILSHTHGKTIFLTYIQSQFGRLPNVMLYRLGYTKDMIRKIPTLFSKDGFKKLKNLLSLYGIREVTYRTKGRKYYLMIKH
ncbi:MAG: hypothetical protein [Siphoviridae sp. ctvD11]|nr:MAG: hypothetical protein [Siphoviridae sp. ctvD11]